MIVRSRTIGWSVFFPVIVVLGTLGCGTGDSGPGSATDTLSMLDQGVQALDSELDTHYQTVTGILDSSAAPEVATEGFVATTEAAPEASTPQDQEWQAIEQERENYGEQMHRILDDLGESVTEIGDCGMMMGGRMFGDQNAVQTCSCEPYMDSSTEEIELHLREMERWMEHRDAQGLLQEMDRHREEMRTRIQQMGAHMREQYGSPGDGMMRR